MQLLDLFFKSTERIRDILFFYLKWKILLKRLGKKSYIKKGVVVSGNPKRISIGTEFKIWEKCTLAVGTGEIILGNNGLLGVNSYINASEAKVIVGNNVAIAPYCQIYSYSHHYHQNSLVTESFLTGDVIIKDNVLIGSNTVILPGVVIEEGSIIAAGSVVNSNVPKNTVYGGVPAKEIKKR